MERALVGCLEVKSCSYPVVYRSSSSVAGSWRSIALLSAARVRRRPRRHRPLTPLTVGLGYIPSVQFAQFYRAQQQGYYRDAGLDVTFQNEIDPNLITLIGQGAVDIGLADGTSVIPAVGQDIPISTSPPSTRSFPNVVMTPADSGIKTRPTSPASHWASPGRYGSSWIMLQALLASAGLTVDDIEIRDYPDFGQATALQQGQVDAATASATTSRCSSAGRVSKRTC